MIAWNNINVLLGLALCQSLKVKTPIVILQRQMIVKVWTHIYVMGVVV